MVKFLKISAVVLASLATVVAAMYISYLIITRDCRLDKNKLTGVGQKIIICDADGNEIMNTSVSGTHTGVKVSELDGNTINAFVASEDRTFYSHNGLNYKRMLRALYINVTSAAFKEGASTISQQLIKNTHLSSDKTISRKLKEIRLTKKLEKTYSKDKIMEMYLNTIYFGHNCYGLQSAAHFYFDKCAENLNLNESAVLSGLLSSPNNYSPFKSPEKCLKRRNIVLNAMLDCGFITENEYKETLNLPIEPKQADNTEKYSDYVNGVFDEIEEIGFDAYNLSDECRIKTFMDPALQAEIEKFDFECDNSLIVTTNAGGVSAFKSTIGCAKRQIGSTAKPIMVYAPAIEERLISPYTRILDEKIDFNGYSPENFDKKYHGFVTVADSLKYSYNVPAVKTLNALTIPKCEEYLKAMDIYLDGDEKNLSLALGAMKYGLSLKDLADKYSVFPSGGTYTSSRFIDEIVDKEGKTLYKSESGKTRVFSEGTCSLTNAMLMETSKSGTAKKLKNYEFDVASKTGTCGNSDGNTDAYAISYTSSHTIGVWLGDKDNNRLSITGGGDCCEYVAAILDILYADKTPAALDIESGTTTVNIDSEEYYENNKVILADKNSPKLNVLTVRTLKGTEPLTYSDRFTNPAILTPKISVKDGTVNIELCHTKYYAFLIKRGENEEFETIYDGKWQEKITDSPKNGCYTYTVTPYFDNNGKRFIGKTITLPSVNLNSESTPPQIKIPSIVDKDWYNM